MDPQLQALRCWHDLITIYALLLGFEGPVLLWVGTMLERPRREGALALVPVAAFAWGAWSVKLINDQAINAASRIFGALYGLTHTRRRDLLRALRENEKPIPARSANCWKSA